jgi:hypothetical protein
MDWLDPSHGWLRLSFEAKQCLSPHTVPPTLPGGDGAIDMETIDNWRLTPRFLGSMTEKSLIEDAAA